MKYFILLSASLLFLFACKAAGADAGTTTDDGGGTTPPVTYTVNIDRNGGTAGTYTPKIVTAGDSFAKPSDAELPSMLDHEVAYYSLEADKPNTIFHFGSTPVNSNITLYPHYRYTIAKVSTLLDGNWLSYKDNSTKAETLYRIKATDLSLAKCLISSATNPDLSDNSNSNILSTLKSMPIDTSLSGTITGSGGQTYTISGTSSVYNIQVASLFDDIPLCNYGSSYKYSLTKYITDATNEILMNQFEIFYPSETITLKSYTSNEINLEIVGGLSVRNGSYKLVKTQ